MNLSFKSRPVRWLAGAFCLLVALLLVALLWPLPKVSGLTINFVGFTNAPGQPPWALFGVTNHSRKSITFIVPETQVHLGQAWAEVDPGIDPPGLTLDGGRGTNVSVAVPLNGETWRMPIIWAHDPSTAEIYLRRGKNLLRTAKAGSLSGWQYGGALTGHTNFSAQIELTSAEPEGPSDGSQPFRSQTNRTSSAAGSRR